MRQLLTLQGAPRSVAINLSARQFTQSSLALFIEQVLQEEEMHPRHIEFEITGMVMSDQRAIAMLENLADMGVQLDLMILARAILHSLISSVSLCFS